MSIDSIGSSTRNVILDLGGVIIPIQPIRSFEAFARLSGWSTEEVITFFKKNALFKTYENGDLSTQEFLQLLAHHLLLSKEDIVSAWNELLLEIPRERIEFLQRLSSKHPLYLLSNTNELHIKAIEKQLSDRGLPSLHQLFVKPYFSYEIHLSKPGREVYEYVLNDANLVATETVFVDDVEENALGANLVGIKGIHLDLNESCLEKLFNDV